MNVNESQLGHTLQKLGDEAHHLLGRGHGGGPRGARLLGFHSTLLPHDAVWRLGWGGEPYGTISNKSLLLER